MAAAKKKAVFKEPCAATVEKANVNLVGKAQKVSVEATEKAVALMMIKLIGPELRSADASAAS